MPPRRQPPATRAALPADQAEARPGPRERPPVEPPRAAGDGPDPALEKDLDRLAAELDGAPAAEGADSDLASGGLATLMDDAFGEGRRLGRLGDCALIASHDGLTAYLRGTLPEGATYEDVTALLAQAGVTFGIVTGHIHQALPKRRVRRTHRGRRDAALVESGDDDVEVARGQPPVPPADTRVEYGFQVTEEEAFPRFEEVLRNPSLPTLRQAPALLPFVAADQVLARVHKKAGKPGRDVFGRVVPPPLPPEVRLEGSDFVELAADGESCRARICGYVGFQGGIPALLPPLWIAPDLMSAGFVYRPLQSEAPAPSADQIRAVLAAHDVTYGIQEETIDRLATDLAAGLPVEPCTLVAVGLEAEDGAKTVWSFCFEPDLTRYFAEIHRILTNARRLDYLVGYAEGLSGKPVSAGERIAEKKGGIDGVMGRDVFGEEFMPSEPKEAHLEAGDFVSFIADGAVCVADIYGYLGIDEERVTVVPALWVDPELTTAYFVNLSQFGEPHAPTPAEIDQLLEHVGVKYGVDNRAIGVLCEKLRQKLPCDIAEPIARAAPPRPGKDGRFEFAVDLERRPSLFRDDGSVDFRAPYLAPILRERDLIGAATAAVDSTPGTDLWGRPLSARDGVSVAVDLGKGVRQLQGPDGHTWFQADLDGKLMYRDRRDRTPATVYLAVHHAMVIQGDVDYTTGNVEYPGNVEVRGSIQSGFSVKAEGNVTVGGSVEEGAVIEAGGSVAVAHGVLGGKTRIAAGDAVYAKFVQEAQVRAGGDVVVTEYLRDANVRAGGEVTLVGRAGNERSGAILGGLTAAARRISACRIGAEGSKPTSLLGGVDPDLLQQASRLQRLLEQGEAVIGKALRSLSLEKLDRRQLKAALLGLVLRAKGPRRQVLSQSVRKLLQLQGRCDQTARQRAEVLAQLAELARQSRIEVTGTVAVRTAIRIGDCTLVVREEGTPAMDVTFSLGQDPDGKDELRMVAS
ncbi:MAG: flagellar assembly protein A [Gemmatimonadota bacterium]